jgi:uncharacterized protein (DUF1501 family)
MLTRRRFLGSGVGAGAGITFVSLGGTVPALFAQAAAESARADQTDHVLVAVELTGGNDGLNTLIPFDDARYYRNRRTLGIPKPEVLKLSDQVGLHPKMTAMAELFKAGRVAIVQGAGYPEPDRSHFRSMEIWHTASVDKAPMTSGWLGRYLDATSPGGVTQSLPGLALTTVLPQAFQAETAVVPVISQIDVFRDEEGETAAEAKLRRKLSTASASAGGPVAFLRHQAAATYRTADLLKEAASKYKSSVQYPAGDLGDQLRRAAQIINANLGARVLFTSQDGYDTHADQGNAHGELLGTLSEALAAFDKDLATLGFADRVVVMVFSEFGRRVDENASRGTDHGAASCMFLMGSKVKGGLVGQYPSLGQLGDGDLIFSTDFRSVYATLLEHWLGCRMEKVLGQKYPTLDLLPAQS